MNDQVADFIADEQLASLCEVRVAAFEFLKEVRYVVDTPHEPVNKAEADQDDGDCDDYGNRKDDCECILLD